MNTKEEQIIGDSFLYFRKLRRTRWKSADYIELSDLNGSRHVDRGHHLPGEIYQVLNVSTKYFFQESSNRLSEEQTGPSVYVRYEGSDLKFVMSLTDVLRDKKVG